jgi:hypothetical protein
LFALIAVGTHSSLRPVTALLTIIISTRVNFYKAVNDAVDKSFTPSLLTNLKSTTRTQSGQEPESILRGWTESLYRAML